jgi:hypothetical protein
VNTPYRPLALILTYVGTAVADTGRTPDIARRTGAEAAPMKSVGSANPILSVHEPVPRRQSCGN